MHSSRSGRPADPRAVLCYRDGRPGKRSGRRWDRRMADRSCRDCSGILVCSAPAIQLTSLVALWRLRPPSRLVNVRVIYSHAAFTRPSTGSVRTRRLQTLLECAASLSRSELTPGRIAFLGVDPSEAKGRGADLAPLLGRERGDPRFV